MIGIDISALYKKIGIDTTKLIKYKIPEEQKQPVSIIYDVPEIKIEKKDVYNYLSMPIMFPVTFKGGNYDIFNNGKIDSIFLFDFRLPDTTICSFKAQKKTTETLISGGNSKIIEVWSDLLWEMNIKGFVIPNPDITTEEIIEQIITFARVKDVEVIGDLFTWLDIKQIFIKDIDIQQNVGMGDILAFSINCFETKPAELIIE